MQYEKINLQKELEIANKLIEAQRELIEIQKKAVEYNRERAQRYKALAVFSNSYIQYN